MRLQSLGFGVLLCSTVYGCSAEKKEAGISDTSTVAGSNDLGGMEPKAGMSMTHSDTVADRASADLEQFASASDAQIKALLPAHTRAVEELVADCEKMMRMMKITPPAKWTKANSEIRSDLSRMKGMSASQIKAFVPEHRDHVQGILDMRQDMMKMNM